MKIKTGIKCPKCSWDDAREFFFDTSYFKQLVCPKCAHRWTVEREKERE